TRTCFDSVGCETPETSAARVKCRVFATATKYASCWSWMPRSFIAIGYEDTPHHDLARWYPKPYGVVVVTTTTPRTRGAVARSTVMLKAVMATSGLIMVLYLLAHMYGNLKVFGGQDAFDTYAHHLRTIGQPFLPYA